MSMKPRMGIEAACGGLILVATGLSGCAAAVEADPGSDRAGPQAESVATSTEELIGCGCNGDSVRWYQSTHFSGVTVGPAQNDYICWAAEYNGMNPSDSPNNYPYLSVYTNNVNWIVAGTGKMACVRRCCFYSNHPNQDQILVSEGFQAKSVAQVGESNIWGGKDMWLADSMALPQGMYHFGAYPERALAQVNQNSNPGFTTLGATVWASSTKSSTLYTYGRSFFVGIPHGSPPHLVKQKAFGFSAGGEYLLLPAASGICAPTYVQGMSPYDDPNAYLSVWVGADGFWRAQSTFQYGRTLAGICFYYDQSN